MENPEQTATASPVILDPRVLAAKLPPPRPKPPTTVVLGVVVGDHGIPTTIAAVRYDARLLTPGDPLMGEEPVFETVYTLLNREQIESLSYPAIAARVNMLASRLWNRDNRGDYHVLVDASDVGRPVVDSIRGSILPAVHVTSVRVKGDETADRSILWRNDATVGLAYLVSRLRAIHQGHRLSVHASLTAMTDALSDHTADNATPSPDLRALALCCASEFLALSYDVGLDLLPSPDF